MERLDYTPLARFTDDELLREVYMKDAVTDHELELAHRLEYALEYQATLLEELDRFVVPAKGKYKEVA
jgi:hypothetical protein